MIDGTLQLPADNCSGARQKESHCMFDPDIAGLLCFNSHMSLTINIDPAACQPLSTALGKCSSTEPTVAWYADTLGIGHVIH